MIKAVLLFISILFYSANSIIDWLTAQSVLNFNLIAELYFEEDASYKGAVPMCGFGPGAYIMANW